MEYLLQHYHHNPAMPFSTTGSIISIVWKIYKERNALKTPAYAEAGVIAMGGAVQASSFVSQSQF